MAVKPNVQVYLDPIDYQKLLNYCEANRLSQSAACSQMISKFLSLSYPELNPNDPRAYKISHQDMALLMQQFNEIKQTLHQDKAERQNMYLQIIARINAATNQLEQMIRNFMAMSKESLDALRRAFRV